MVCCADIVGSNSAGRAYSDHGVRSLNDLGPAHGVFAVEELVCRAVHTLASVDHLAECGRQLVVRCVAAGPERVAANLGNSIVVQVPEDRVNRSTRGKRDFK